MDEAHIVQINIRAFDQRGREALAELLQKQVGLMPDQDNEDALTDVELYDPDAE